MGTEQANDFKPFLKTSDLRTGWIRCNNKNIGKKKETTERIIGDMMAGVFFDLSRPFFYARHATPRPFLVSAFFSYSSLDTLDN